MATWAEYKQSLNTEPPEFAWARSGDFSSLSRYLRNGGNPNATNSRGHSLLMLAAYNDHGEIAQLLLDNDAFVDATDFAGNSVLMAAAFRGHARMVDLLLEYDADPDLRNHEGLSAHDFAKNFGRHDAARLLCPEQWRATQHLTLMMKMLMGRTF